MVNFDFGEPKENFYVPDLADEVPGVRCVRFPFFFFIFVLFFQVRRINFIKTFRPKNSEVEWLDIERTLQ